jgi:hypothetical protein
VSTAFCQGLCVRQSQLSEGSVIPFGKRVDEATRSLCWNVAVRAQVVSLIVSGWDRNDGQLGSGGEVWRSLACQRGWVGPYSGGACVLVARAPECRWVASAGPSQICSIFVAFSVSLRCVVCFLSSWDGFAVPAGRVLRRGMEASTSYARLQPGTDWRGWKTAFATKRLGLSV